jgi:excisionase family DNA binding protein
MNVKEMAKFLKVPENTAYKMLLARTIDSFKLGKLRRIRKSDLVAYVNANRVLAIKSR